jgi:hypothetical protein
MVLLRPCELEGAAECVHACEYVYLYLCVCTCVRVHTRVCVGVRARAGGRAHMCAQEGFE